MNARSHTHARACTRTHAQAPRGRPRACLPPLGGPHAGPAAGEAGGAWGAVAPLVHMHALAHARRLGAALAGWRGALGKPPHPPALHPVAGVRGGPRRGGLRRGVWGACAWALRRLEQQATPHPPAPECMLRHSLAEHAACVCPPRAARRADGVPGQARDVRREQADAQPADVAVLAREVSLWPVRGSSERLLLEQPSGAACTRPCWQVSTSAVRLGTDLALRGRVARARCSALCVNPVQSHCELRAPSTARAAAALQTARAPASLLARSGPLRYDCVAPELQQGSSELGEAQARACALQGRWVYHRDGRELLSQLEQELGALVGASPRLLE